MFSSFLLALVQRFFFFFVSFDTSSLNFRYSMTLENCTNDSELFLCKFSDDFLSVITEHLKTKLAPSLTALPNCQISVSPFASQYALHRNKTPNDQSLP